MQFSAKDIAHILGGEVKGDASKLVSKFSKIEEADSESICFFANEKYAQYLSSTAAGIILVPRNFDMSVSDSSVLILVDNPYESAAKLLEFYKAKIENVGIEKGAHVSEQAQIGSNPFVAAFAYISEHVTIGNNVKIFPHVFIGKNVKIGDDVVLYSGVKIYDDCEIGNRCIIHSGVVIGSDGFGFAPTADGTFSKIPQIGNVILESDVEVGANTVIDRATMGSTRVLSGTKLDNLIQIAHNVVIGKNTVIAAQTGVSGSTKIGENVMIGGQVGIVGHITIGDRVKINAQSGVSKSIENEGAVTGSPAYDYSKMLRAQALIKKLPEMMERILNLEKKQKGDE